MSTDRINKHDQFNSFCDTEITKLMLLYNRLKTFVGWPFDKSDKSSCNSLELAKAGFIMTSNDDAAPSASCVCCFKDLLWEEEDIPKNEHLVKMPHCAFAKMVAEKNELEFTVQDILKILMMREMSRTLGDLFDQDLHSIKTAINYNDEFVKKTIKKL
uniref:Baculoviral IAP repeat-containing protein 6 n=1 Tax=Parastrongyloides trichosuri TaxID=131310 RepID=A0A0N4ZQL9_PARTI